MIKFSASQHFKNYENCKNCNGTGYIETLEAEFNPSSMDFDVITEKKCRYCLEQSIEDFYSYMEDG